VSLGELGHCWQEQGLDLDLQTGKTHAISWRVVAKWRADELQDDFAKFFWILESS
jgi:hypothetical protein